MAQRYRGHEALVAQDRTFHGGFVEGDAPVADIDASVLQGGDLVQRVELQQCEFHLRTRGTIGADHLGQAAIESGGHEADAEAQLLGLMQAAADRLHLVHALEHLHRLPEEQPPRIGEADRPRAALEQHHAQLFLQLLDLSAQRRLRDVQQLRRAGEVPLTSHGHEVADLPEFQSIPPGYGGDRFGLGLLRCTR